MKENASSLGIFPSKFMVAGHSSGRGLTAAVTLKARDTKEVEIAFQMPLYPMIDHRQDTESAKTMHSVPVWNSKTNAVAWNIYLNNSKGAVLPYASPSLNNDYKDFPPAITFVGDLEPFKDETINYVKASEQEQVPVKYKLFEGAFYGFEMLGDTAIAREAKIFQYEYFDKYAM